MAQNEVLYERFVAGFVSDGRDEIPGDWPEDVRRRCRLFLLMHRSRSVRLASQSLIGLLVEEGIGADLTLDEPAPAALVDDNTPGASEERYVFESELGRGGMGRVLLSYDRDFRRRIAMKVLLDEGLEPSRVARFFEEAQATAQLEHPNIAPVYDLGVDASGAPFFTMKWIRGRNLEELLAERESEQGPADLSLVRLVQILQQVAMAIEFAHSRSVVHRDLKPQNVMIGDYGEVLVVDWGLAKILGRPDRADAASGSSSDDLPVTTDRREAGVVSQAGHVVGSLAYMAPEQARGETGRVDARTDVFGLGAILYSILCGSPPYDGNALGELLGRAREGRVDAPSRRAPDVEIPTELESICVRALAADPAQRFGSAREFHDALQSWVEGIHDAERRAEEARALLADADVLRAALREAEQRLDRAKEELDAETSGTEDHAPLEEKERLWDLQEGESRGRDEVDSLFSRTTAAFHAVLRVRPSDPQARAALADLYGERMASAEARGDVAATRVFEGLVRQYADGERLDLLDADGQVRLESGGAAERFVLCRFVERGPTLVAEELETVDGASLDRRLPIGSYVASFERRGHRRVLLPFRVRRGEELSEAVRFYRDDEIPDGFVQVAAGRSIIGAVGEELPTFDRLPRFVDEFFISCFPVTLEEYAEFLSSLDDARIDELDLLPSFGRQQYLTRGDDGRFETHPSSKLPARAPVIGITRSAMLEYCAWRGSLIGQEVRLPTELEWERAARGADGRLFPWGNGFDWALCKGGRSRPGTPTPEPIGAFSTDLSPFGVRDMAGGVRDLCDGWFEEDCSPCRGGSWFQTATPVFRGATRTMLRDGAKTTDIGFRVCFSMTVDGSLE